MSLRKVYCHHYQTTKHKIYVLYYILKFCISLIARALKHDLSKYRHDESKHFVGLKVLKNITYGSNDYLQLLEQLKPATELHYTRNPHHPEYHPNGINDMTLVDLVEMFFDWYASTKKHNDGNMYRSININSQRFNMSEQLCDIFRNSANYLIK